MTMTREKRKADVASCPTNDEPSRHVVRPTFVRLRSRFDFIGQSVSKSCRARSAVEFNQTEMTGLLK